MDASQITKLRQKQNTVYQNRAQTVDSSTMIWMNQIQSSKYIAGVATCTGLQQTDVPTEAVCPNKDGTTSFGGGGKQMTLATGSTQQYPSVFRGAAGSASQIYSSDNILLQKAGRNYCAELIQPSDPYVVLPSCYTSNTNGPTANNPTPSVNNQDSNPYLPAFDTYYSLKHRAPPTIDQNQKHYVHRCNGQVIEPPFVPPNRPWPSLMVGQNTAATVVSNAIAYNGTNVYVTGTYSGTVDLYSSAWTSTPFITFACTSDPGHTSVYDAFVSSYDREGAMKWAACIKMRTAPALYPPIAQGYSVAADGGGVTVLGGFTGQIELYDGISSNAYAGTFNPAQGTGRYTMTSNAGGLFVARYGLDGRLQWANFIDNVLTSGVQIPSTPFEISPFNTNSIACNGLNVYVAGSTQGGSTPLLIYPPNQFATPVLQFATTVQHAFLIQYNLSTGSLAWATHLDYPSNTAYNSQGITVQCDANAVYLAGYFLNGFNYYNTYTSTANATVLGSVTNSVPPNDGIFLLSYTNAGTFRWANQCNNGNVAYNNRFVVSYLQLALDSTTLTMGALFNNDLQVILASGAQHLTGLSGSVNLALVQYNLANGQGLWMSKINNLALQGDINTFSTDGLDMVSDGYHIFITGGFDKTNLVFYNGGTTDPSSASGTLTPLNTTATYPMTAFVACYSHAGALDWITKAGGASSSAAGFGIATNSSRLLITGWGNGPVNWYNANGTADPTVVGQALVPSVNALPYYSYVVAYDTNGTILP